MPGARWTVEKIRAMAPAFSTRTDLAKKHGGAYRFARSIPGLLDELFGNQRFVWDKEGLIKEASKYDTKAEFKRGSGGAYTTCMAKFPGLIDDLFDNQIRYWKDESVVAAEARKYGTRTEFRKGSIGAYKSALSKFPHLLEQIFGKPLVKPWKLEDLILEAKKYESRAEFRINASGACMSFFKFPGELDKIFPLKYRYWGNEDDIREEASKYKTKAEFVSGCISAYGAALELGIIDDLGFAPGNSGFDTTAPAYIYLAELTLKDGKDGVLFGITNRTPKGRYTRAERSFMKSLRAFMFDVGSDALKIETMLRREFIAFAVGEGQSPLLFKKGTAGEIVQDVSVDTVLERLASTCAHLPEMEEW